MHHLTPRAPPICRKDHPCLERSASHFQLFPLTMGDRRWARAGRAVPPFGADQLAGVTSSGKDADGTFGAVRVALPALRELDQVNYLRRAGRGLGDRRAVLVDRWGWVAAD
jgi:hypothetical protein